MNTGSPKLQHHQPSGPKSPWAKPARRLVYLAGLVTVSTCLMFAFVHTLLEHVVDTPISFRTLLEAGLFWPLLALSMAATLANHAVITSLRQLIRRPRSRGRDDTLLPPRSAPPATAGLTRQVLQLTRGAERLDLVERDLIRKISECFTVDATIQQLLTEMRICTNRLRGQISDLERLEQATEREADSRSPRPARQEEKAPSV